MLVYQKVSQYLESHGIRQSFVAEQCGIPQVVFHAMMQGRRKLYAEDLRAICYALNVRPETFIEFHSTESA